MPNRKRLPHLSRDAGYVRTPIGTARVDTSGTSLYATTAQLARLAEETGIVINAEGAIVALDEEGEVLRAVPPGDECLEAWIQELTARLLEHAADEAFFRGYAAGLKLAGAPPPAPVAPRTSRPPRPGSMRDKVRRILECVEDVEWLTAQEVAEHAEPCLGEELNERSVYNALVKEVDRGGVLRWEDDEGRVRYRLA